MSISAMANSMSEACLLFDPDARTAMSGSASLLGRCLLLLGEKEPVGHCLWPRVQAWSPLFGHLLHKELTSPFVDCQQS
jgi:hypothetical protein